MTADVATSPIPLNSSRKSGFVLPAYIAFVFAVLLAVGPELAQAAGIDIAIPFSGARLGIALLLAFPAAVWFLVKDENSDKDRHGKYLLLFGTALFLFGSAWGLFVAPREQYMGETQRIMYVHVPTAWTWMVAVLFAFGSAIAFLFTSNYKWDSRVEASLEVSGLFAFLLCMQGSIWAKPTWGVWWDWDPRLTSVAVLLFATLGVIALRNFVDDAARRAIWSSVATIIATVDLPIVYFSVKWWNSLHQQQSSPNTVSPDFYIPLRVNAFAVLLLMTGFIMLRSRIASLRLAQEIAPPPVLTAEEVGEMA